MLSDVWELDAGGWHLLAHAPEGRIAHRIVFDPQSDQLVSSGGWAGRGLYGEDLHLVLPTPGSRWIGSACSGGRLQAALTTETATLDLETVTLDLEISGLPKGTRSSLFLYGPQRHDTEPTLELMPGLETSSCRLLCRHPLSWSSVRNGRATLQIPIPGLRSETNLGGASQGLLIQALSLSKAGVPMISQSVQVALD